MSRVAQLAPRRIRASADALRDAIAASRQQLGTAFAPLLDSLELFVDNVAEASAPASSGLLTRTQAAQRLGVSDKTFRLHVRAGRLPPVILPSAQGVAPLKRWDPDVLDRFIAQRS